MPVCTGGLVDFRFGADQSKNSVISIWALSRSVNDGRSKRVSINFSTAVKSAGLCETNAGFANGEKINSGTRNPVVSNTPVGSPAIRIGFLLSGLGMLAGGT